MLIKPRQQNDQDVARCTCWQLHTINECTWCICLPLFSFPPFLLREGSTVNMQAHERKRELGGGIKWDGFPHSGQKSISEGTKKEKGREEEGKRGVIFLMLQYHLLCKSPNSARAMCCHGVTKGGRWHFWMCYLVWDHNDSWDTDLDKLQIPSLSVVHSNTVLLVTAAGEVHQDRLHWFSIYLNVHSAQIFTQWVWANSLQTASPLKTCFLELLADSLTKAGPVTFMHPNREDANKGLSQSVEKYIKSCWHRPVIQLSCVVRMFESSC